MRQPTRQSLISELHGARQQQRALGDASVGIAPSTVDAMIYVLQNAMAVTPLLASMPRASVDPESAGT